jgi:hypothetical protein
MSAAAPRSAPDAAVTGYRHTRFWILRLLAVVYATAFLILVQQLEPLLGSGGLLPAATFLERVRAASGGSAWNAFVALPTLFWLDCSDTTLAAAAWLGLGLSLLALAGATNALLQLALWAIYLSFVQIGQLFYGYGWESQLAETGFLAIFLCPLSRWRPWIADGPPRLVIWLFRWLIIRIMLGAGAIKLRGDPCWLDLTCLAYHYETQPIPNPLSWWLHAMPLWFHRAGTLFNHVVELAVPFLLLGPRRIRHAAGVLLVLFQAMLISSGNLSFLNWLTIVPALACFDDGFWESLSPRRRRRSTRPAGQAPPRPSHRVAAWLLAAVVGLLSIQPVLNLVSPRQIMNTSFDPLRLVNTYGAFGSIGRVRNEIVIEGTRDATVGPQTRWQEYELPCKPGDVARRPCVISPYHYRLDWQIWFAAMSTVDRQPWLVHLVAKLLDTDAGVRSLLARDPFGDRPPTHIRLLLYRYELTGPGDDDPSWWRRRLLGEYLRPLARDDPALRDYLQRMGWGGG